MFERMTKITVAFVVIALLGTVNLCLAQTSSGAINGTITDSTGAVIPGVNIEITNTGTGEKRKISTTETGSYTISNLTVGVYNVTATGTGFALSTAKDVKVSVAFTTTVNLTLNAAGASEVVEVSSGDAQTQINTTDQQLSTLIDNRKILDLPLLNRDPNSLILLAPGAIQTTSRLGGFSVNGSRERNNNFLVDGADNNDTDVPGGAGGLSTPNIDATQEFRVITSNFNAEYGRNTGAIIN
ncbi:MAG: carboxypeptidase regulatory-like domain-containing protein, partial [Pyrinomonadaceae bacterium]